VGHLINVRTALLHRGPQQYFSHPRISLFQPSSLVIYLGHIFDKYKVWSKRSRESDFASMDNGTVRENSGENTEEDSASAEDSCAITEEDSSNMRWGQLDEESIPMQKKPRLDWSRWFADRSHYQTWYTYSGQIPLKINVQQLAPQPSEFVDIALQVHTVALTFPYFCMCGAGGAGK